jgi:MSHA biogenesis protein MshP
MRTSKQTSLRHQRGLSSLLVIAVIVMLGSVSAYAVNLVTSAHAGNGLAHAQLRAQGAARAGLDWGRYRIAVPAAPLCTAVQSITTLPGSLAPYTVTVRCSAAAPVQESGVAVRAYALSVSACNRPAGGQCPNAAGGPDYVERTVTATLVR